MAGKGFTVRKEWDNPREHQMPENARVPAEVRLGSVLVTPATVLAPMAGVTDTVFRRFIRHASMFTRDQGSGIRNQDAATAGVDDPVTNAQSGCGLLMTEFTSADGLSRMRESKRRRYLTFYDDEHPIGAQLFGSNAETLADAARIVEETGFDTVDLNLGCPAKRVVGCNGGSGLLRDSAEDRRDFSRHPQGSHDSLHRQVPHGLERQPDCLPGVGANGGGRGAGSRGPACPHS